MQQIDIGNLEPLAAFLSRRAAARGVTLWDFRVHGDIRARNNKQPRYYDRVSTITGIDPNALRRHDLVKVGGAIKVFDMTFDLKDVWAKSVRVCPRCISDDVERGSGRIETRPHLRFTWMLRTLGRCPVHGCPLVVIGPDYDRISYGDFAGTLARFWKAYDAVLAASTDNASRSPDFASDIYFHYRIERAATLDVPEQRGSNPLKLPMQSDPTFASNHRGEGSMLEEMPPPAALLLTEVIGGMELFGDRYKRSYASDEDRQAAVVAGFEITSRGYEGLRQFLAKRDENHWRVSRRGHFKNLYGRLQEFLSSRIDDDGYRNVIRFVAEHAISTHALGPEDAFLGFALPRKLHSIRTAEVSHGIHRMTLRSILASAGLLPAGAGDKADGRVVVAADILEALIADWRDRLPAEEAKARFGISSAALDDIARRGLLLEKDQDKRRRSHLTKASYLELLRQLECLPRGEPDAGMRNLRDVTRIASRSYGEIINLMLDGAITKVVVDARHDEKFGFDRIFLDPLEVKLATQTAMPPGVNFQCVERMLGTTTKTVKRLAATGLLKTFQAENPSHRKPQRYVAPSALEEFQNTYISLWEYAKGRGQVAIVKARLKAAGVMPTFEEPGTATYYRRAALPD